MMPTYWRELPWTNSGRSNSSSSSSLSSPSLSSTAATHQLLNLVLFAPSRNLILHLLLKSEEVSYICLGGRALLEDGHDFVGGHLEPTRKEVESALNPSNGRGRVEGLLAVLKRHDIEPGVVVVVVVVFVVVRGVGFFS